MRSPPGSQLVFQQIVTSGAAGYGTFLKSDSRFNDWLGKADEVDLFAVADRATGSGTLTVIVEEAADEERTWFNPNTSGAALSGAVTSSGISAITGGDTLALRLGRPSLGFRRLSVGLNGAAISARVRVWAAGRGGHRQFNKLLFRERMEGTTPLYAPWETCAWLSSADNLAIGVLLEDTAGSPTVTALFGESPNGRAWTTTNLNLVDSASGNISVAAGTTSNAPPGGFIRFGVQLAGVNPAATLCLWATGRDVRPA